MRGRIPVGNDVGQEGGFSNEAREVDTALGWLRAAGDLQAERWGAYVARTTGRVEALRDRYPELGNPRRALVVASFVAYARASGLDATELAALVEIPEWMKEDLDMVRECASLAGLRPSVIRSTARTSARHSCRPALQRGARRGPTKKFMDG